MFLDKPAATREKRSVAVLIYIDISYFVFHLFIMFLFFLSVRSIYSSELCLECMLLLSCLECFTMLAVVVSFFLAFDPCLVFKD